MLFSGASALLLLLLCSTAASVHGAGLTPPAAEPSAGEMLVNLTVPDFQITKDDMYVCTTIELPAQPMKLVGVIPQADMAVVHHILLYGCKTPYKMPDAQHPRSVWECMGLPMCHDGGSDILYGWGRNAPRLQLPDGVGFTVGPGSGVRYVVAQVHYLSSRRPTNDHSGVTLVLRPQPVPYAAGVIAFATGFVIPPRTPSYLVDNECCYRGHQPLTAFAMRVHTHALGRSVYLTRPTMNSTGIEEVARGDPQLPQAFYPVQHHTIWPGDRLKTTCDFNSESKALATSAGSTHSDEMCNLYLMVFGWHPFISMCGGGDLGNGAGPGSMPVGAPFVLDPSPFWDPPDPAHSPLGEMTSVAVAADGALWGLYRGDRVWDGNTFDAMQRVTATAAIPQAVVVRMDPDTGKVLSAWGADTFYMPHMLTIDQGGNVWVVDAGLHQVLKYSAAGELLLTLGTKLAPGSGKDHFCKPTKVAVLRDGTVFVSDGYCNSRMVKFSSNGTYLAEVAVQGGQVVHSLVVDECQKRVYVASRENGFVVAYDISTLEVVHRQDHFGGRVWSLLTRPQGGTLALVWDAGKVARLVNVEAPEQFWDLPGINEEYPHEVALGPAPLALSGANERLHAAYVVPTCPPPTCGKLRRYVLLPDGVKLPNAAEIAAAGPQPLPTAPSLMLSKHGASQGQATARESTSEVLSQSGASTVQGAAQQPAGTQDKAAANAPVQGSASKSEQDPAATPANATAPDAASGVSQSAAGKDESEEVQEKAEEEAEEQAGELTADEEEQEEEREAEEEEAEYQAAEAEEEALEEAEDKETAAAKSASEEEEAEEEAAEEEEAVHAEAKEAIEAEEEEEKEEEDYLEGKGKENSSEEGKATTPSGSSTGGKKEEEGVLVEDDDAGAEGEKDIEDEIEEEEALEEELLKEEEEEEALEEEDEAAGFEDDLSEGDNEDGAATPSGTAKAAEPVAAPASSSGDNKAAAAAEDSKLDVQREQRTSTTQIVVLLVFAATMLTLVVVLALYVLRKFVAGDSHAGPGHTKPGAQSETMSIEDMLRHSKDLDDVEAVGHNGNGYGKEQRRTKEDEERRGLMSGVVSHGKAAQKGRGK